MSGQNEEKEKPKACEGFSYIVI